MSDVRKLAKIVADHSRQIKGLSGGPQAAYSSIEGGSMDSYDSDGKLRLRIGAQDDGTQGVKYVQGPPPPRPTAPVVSVDGPVVRVRWDGMLLGGHIPEDFARIDVHFALASEDLEDEAAVRGNLATSAGNETVLAATSTGTYRVGLVAMSQSRARSEMSEVVDVDVTLVDIEGALDAVVENARGGSNYYSPEPPSGTDHDPDRDLWFDTSVDAEGLVSYSPHRWDPEVGDAGGWVSVADQRTAALQDALGDFEGTVEQRFTDAGDRIDGLETSLTDLDETTLPALRQDLSDAEGRLDGAEQDITDAFGQLESVRRAGVNLVANGSFENGWTGWAAPMGERLAVGHARDGQHVVRLGRTAGNDYPGTDGIEAAPGTIYQVEYWVRKLPGGTDTSLLRMYVQQFRADGTNSGKYASFSVNGGSLPEAEWVKLSGTIEVDEPGTVSVRFAPHVFRQGTQYDIDSVRVVDVTDVTLARQAAEAAAVAYTDAQLSSEAADLAAAIAAAQSTADEALNAADGVIRTYYEPVEPTLVTHPDLKLGDMWYDTTNETAHRWNGSQWNVIQDSNVAVALAKAEEALAAADGKIAAYYQNDKPTEGHVGDLWFDLDDGNAPWYCASEDPAVWVPVRDEEIANAELRAAQDAKDKADQALQDAQEDATEKADAARDQAISAADAALSSAVSGLSSDIEGVRTAANGKNKVTWSTSSPPAVYDGRINDTWFVMSGGGSGARVLSQWRWQGNVWVSMLLSEEVLSSVSIGTGTYGELDGIRLRAGSIYADRIVSGLSQNMVPDPGFVNADINTARINSAFGYGDGVFSIADGVLTISTGGAAAGHPNMSLSANDDLYAWAAYPSMRVVAKAEARVVSGSVSMVMVIRFRRRDGSIGAATMGSYARLTSEWGEHVWTYTLPQDVAGFSIILQVNRTLSNGVAELRSPFVASSVGTTVIEDGAVTTGKLRADVLEVGNLKAGTAEIAEQVSLKIAAAVGRFVEADIGNLSVTGQSRLADVVAEQIAADTARFMELEVGKLVASEGILDEAVIKQLFAEVVVSQMSFADEFIGGNAILEGSITAESGIIGSLDLGVAIVGKLHGQYVEAGSIDTEQLAFGAATGDVLSVDALNFKTAVGLDIRGSSFRAGDAVEMTEDFGIRQFGPDGALNVSLPSDGSPAEFRGDLSARTLTATGRMSIQGPGAIASGGVLELESGVVPPVAGPQITNTWDRTTFPPLTDQEAPAGLAWADGHFWRCVTTSVSLADGGRTRIEKIAPDGTLAGGWDTSFRVNVDGITILNGELYVLAAGRYLDMPGSPERAVVVYDLNGNEQRRWADTLYTHGTYQQGIGNDGTNIILAKSWNDGILRWRKWTPTGTYLETLNSGRVMKSNVTQILYGEFDYADGPKRIVAQQRTDLKAFVCYDEAATAPDDAGRSWYAANFQNPIGLAWDGARFHSLTPDGNLASYWMSGSEVLGAVYGDDTEDWWMGFTWRASSPVRETTIGPLTRFRYLRGARLTVQTGDVPEGVEAARMYLGRGTTPGALSYSVEVDPPGTPATFNYMVFLGFRDGPPTSNSFTTGDPGEIHSAIGNFRVDGSGAGSWGPLRFGADGSLRGAGTVITGEVSHPSLEAGNLNSYDVTITFPAGRFASPPVVMLSHTNGLVAPVPMSGTVTKDSFQLRVWNPHETRNAGSGTVYWAAIDEGA